ncbi:MAG: hypothetical protein ACFFHV_04785 [Promethearchaeota archaeon]
MKKMLIRKISLIFILLILGNLITALLISNYSVPKIESSEQVISITPDREFPSIRSSIINYSNVSVISDGYNNEYWNTKESFYPEIAIDGSNIIHAVWQDQTPGIWGEGGLTDPEIMYANYTEGVGWSNATVISDGYKGEFWNTGISVFPNIAIDGANNLHVIWYDNTEGIWGGGDQDFEIMYVNYTNGAGWSNATVISDGYKGEYWNTGNSKHPQIAVDGVNNLHVVWQDDTNGKWGTDTEIMYVNYTNGAGWSNATVISDGYKGEYWNTGNSEHPVVAVDGANNLHIVWEDNTEGIWGGNTDIEIMYTNFTVATNQWSNATVISDGYDNGFWNTGKSFNPDIILDGLNNPHVVWQDDTPGIWGGGTSDSEIMYAYYIPAIDQWSNATIISDGYNDEYWNTASSDNPQIAVDGSNDFHVVWHDYTSGKWGIDSEIMYANYTEGLGWSNVIVISDGHEGEYWNSGNSLYPDIAINGANNLHIVWQDRTDGIWREDFSDSEIMYCKVTLLDQFIKEFKNASVISDGFQDIWDWNNDESCSPEIAVDGSNTLHAVWQDGTDGIWGTDTEIMYAKYTEGVGWSNATVISDGYGGDWGWNNESSQNPDIAIDGFNNLHVVWQDETEGIWSDSVNDDEIMYVKYTAATGQWSNATVISDGYNAKYWNDRNSWQPKIAVDGLNHIHVVWQDYTDGVWGTDTEIMYVKYITGVGWSNATVISDGYNNAWGWNFGSSGSPDIAVDGSNNLHIVWQDETEGIWGGSASDVEIMYANYTIGVGWSNATVISDGYNNAWGWNTEDSYNPKIVVDGSNNLHVVWEDNSNGIWSFDIEIMYANYTIGVGWSNATVISDGYNNAWGWNTEDSFYPEIAVDGSNNLHIVWQDDTDGVWGTDTEIMYLRSKFIPIKELSSKQEMDGSSNGGDDGKDKILFETEIFIIMIIILITIAVVILSGVVYSAKIRKKKIQSGSIGKKSKLKPLESKVLIKPLKVLKEKEFHKMKKSATTTPTLTTTAVPSEIEKEELKKTESEVDIEDRKILCIVHKGLIEGANYLCPKCNAFYCVRCAKALKKKGEKCWVCDSEIKI